MGLALGAEEAAHAAALFGGSFARAPLRSNDEFSAVIGDGSCASLPRPDTPFLNVACADLSRDGACDRRVFHVAPSVAMRRDAQRLARTTGAVSVWSPSLVRFGAGTLNRRFRERFGTPMTVDAWNA